MTPSFLVPTSRNNLVLTPRLFYQVSARKICWSLIEKTAEESSGHTQVYPAQMFFIFWKVKFNKKKQTVQENYPILHKWWQCKDANALIDRSDSEDYRRIRWWQSGLSCIMMNMYVCKRVDRPLTMAKISKSKEKRALRKKKNNEIQIPHIQIIGKKITTFFFSLEKQNYRDHYPFRNAPDLCSLVLKLQQLTLQHHNQTLLQRYSDFHTYHQSHHVEFRLQLYLLPVQEEEIKIKVFFLV